MINYLYKTTFKMGEIVDLKTHKVNKKAELLKRQMTDVWLFEYFQELHSGQCGWGVEFNVWVSLKGWKFLGCDRYEKVRVPRF